MAELQVLVNNESFIVNLQTLKYAISRNVTSLRPCIFYLLILSTVLHCKSPLFLVPILILLFSCRGFRLSTIAFDYRGERGPQFTSGTESYSEKEMVTHSSVLAWRIPGTVEPGGLLCMGSHRVRHN